MASQSHRPQAASHKWKLAGLALLSIGLAGCIPQSRPAPPPPGPSDEPGPDRPSRLPPDETRNRVAVLVPLTGANAALGQSLLNAANLALLDTGGDKIRITAYDTSSGAAAAANEALAEGSGLILGPLLADDVRAVAPAARREGVPVIAFSNDVSVAGDGVYMMGFHPGHSVDRVISFARARGMQRFGALVSDDVYGQRTTQALNGAVEAAGGQVTGIERFARNPAALRSAATRLSAQGRPEAVLIAAGGTIAVQATPIIRQASPQPRILGTELWATETNIGDHVGLRGAWFAAPSDASFGAYRSRYRARYGANPFRLSTLGYDAVLLTVRIAGDWPIGRRFPERLLRDSTGFVGVDGAFRFGRDGIAQRALEVREVSAGGSRIVSPAPSGFN